jgi:hypothetical protein
MRSYWLNNGPALPVQEVRLVPHARTASPGWVWVLPLSGWEVSKLICRANLYATRQGAEAAQAREAAR